MIEKKNIKVILIKKLSEWRMLPNKLFKMFRIYQAKQYQDLYCTVFSNNPKRKIKKGIVFTKKEINEFFRKVP